MLGRPPNFGVEHDEALHAQAILASYSWLLGQACYQGNHFPEPHCNSPML